MTTKMERIFKEHPPKRPIRDLDSLVDDWLEKFGKDGIYKHMRDEVVDYCAQALTIDTAIIRACESRRPNGKLHNHQSRVPDGVRKLFCSKIRKHYGTVLINDFDELHDWLECLAPVGIGPVTVYDIATRIGAFLGMEPTSVYLHAHVRVGWNKLHGGRRVPEVDGRVPRHMLPPQLRRIPADQVEDCLCAYAEYLGPWLKKSPS